MIDGAARAVGPGGKGHIAISNLTNRATVLLNYKLGDLVTLGAEACQCGRTLTTIERIEGRADDFIALPGGEEIHSLVVQPTLHRVPGVIQVQIVQEELRRFVIRVVYIDGDWTQACHQLTHAMRSALGDDVLVSIERAEALAVSPGDKAKAVISRCHVAPASRPS